MKRCRLAREACVNVIVYQSESQRERQLAKYLTLCFARISSENGSSVLLKQESGVLQGFQGQRDNSKNGGEWRDRMRDHVLLHLSTQPVAGSRCCRFILRSPIVNMLPRQRPVIFTSSHPQACVCVCVGLMSQNTNPNHNNFDVFHQIQVG